MGSPQNDRVRKRIKARRWYWLHKLKTTRGCENCGYDEHGVALVFAHINPLEKSHYCIGQGKGGSGMNGLVKRISGTGRNRNEKYKRTNREYIHDLFQEIRKCKILCMNCHTIEGYDDGEHTRCIETHEIRQGITQ